MKTGARVIFSRTAIVASEIILPNIPVRGMFAGVKWLVFILMLGPAVLAQGQPTNAGGAARGANGAGVLDAVEVEYRRLVAADALALAEVEQWVTQGNGGAALRHRIDERFAGVARAYADFLQQHPEHARARVAYGNFLNESGDEVAAKGQWEKALASNPQDAEAWNNLANVFGHRGPPKKAFEYYAKAIELAPKEATYLQNFATTVFLFRKDAREFFQITEEEVFDRALQLYRRAIALEPDNHELALDVAQCYYSIKPPRPAEAVAAWNYALQIAPDNLQRENAHIHLARFKMREGLFQEARQHLGVITNAFNEAVRVRVLRDLEAREKKAGQTGKGALPVPFN